MWWYPKSVSGKKMSEWIPWKWAVIRLNQAVKHGQKSLFQGKKWQVWKIWQANGHSRGGPIGCSAKRYGLPECQRKRERESKTGNQRRRVCQAFQRANQEFRGHYFHWGQVTIFHGDVAGVQPVYQIRESEWGYHRGTGSNWFHMKRSHVCVNWGRKELSLKQCSKCHVPTGPTESRPPVLFEPDVKSPWQSELEVPEILITLWGGASSIIRIQAKNTTKSPWRTGQC